ncbi:tRNA pseudouridine(38-40) synthase TruA [Rubricoccus marinus]|uniref:tRNA pseudouridine synthase A n=1 Tax=Rubricoccus marinus TaxID=716817 RepID=A0A259U1F0_9BACT|nr:tRNA pseudouridine(38-40) synthase TruA [Rubricoccus marinus]OZC03801.1 tRNA pseudouridine(38-40) synthase TruA [Rubricoccus marinus]
MARTRLLIEYDGTEFSGWQTQPGARTVQGEIERALTVIMGSTPPFMGSGRTDAGVHARGQVAHVDTPEPVDAFRLRGSLNGLLPESVAVLGVEPAPEDFHARYSARQRTYHYHVATAPRALDRLWRTTLRSTPDVETMNEAAQALLGTHEFSSFCRTRSETTNRVCTVHHAQWVPEAREGDWRFEIQANRYVHGMVRAIVGTLLEIGRGRREADSIPDLLASGDRRLAGPAAPAHGLVLHRVEYDAPVFTPTFA